MSGKRLGKLGVCTQPLFTERAWLRDWVDYQFQIGADEVLMHWAKVSSLAWMFSYIVESPICINIVATYMQPDSMM